MRSTLKLRSLAPTQPPSPTHPVVRRGSIQTSGENRVVSFSGRPGQQQVDTLAPSGAISREPTWLNGAASRGDARAREAGCIHFESQGRRFDPCPVAPQARRIALRWETTAADRVDRAPVPVSGRASTNPDQCFTRRRPERREPERSTLQSGRRARESDARGVSGAVRDEEPCRRGRPGNDRPHSRRR